MSLLEGGNVSVMGRSDVRAYFPTIEPALVAQMLFQTGCDVDASLLLVTWLDSLNRKHGFRGLPLGTEASAVLGNAFLKPLDDLLVDLGVPFLRYMDDVLFFGRENRALEQLLPLVDERLAELRLERSSEKTMLFSEPAAAVEALRNRGLASVASVLQQRPAAGIGRVYELWQELCRRGGWHGPAVRFVLQVLTRRRDPYAATWLGLHPSVAAIEPKLSARYLVEAGTDNDRDSLLDVLREPRSDQREALDLHALRCFSARRMGSAEQGVFFEIASDPRRPAPTRGWAWAAWASSGARERVILDSVDVEEDPDMCRWIFGCVRFVEQPSLARIRSLLAKKQETAPDLRYTAQWLNVA